MKIRARPKLQRSRTASGEIFLAPLIRATSRIASFTLPKTSSAATRFSSRHSREFEASLQFSIRDSTPQAVLRILRGRHGCKECPLRISRSRAFCELTPFGRGTPLDFAIWISFEPWKEIPSARLKDQPPATHYRLVGAESSFYAGFQSFEIEMECHSVHEFEPKQLGCLKKTNADSRKEFDKSARLWLSRPRRLRFHFRAVGANHREKLILPSRNNPPCWNFAHTSEVRNLPSSQEFISRERRVVLFVSSSLA